MVETSTPPIRSSQWSPKSQSETSITFHDSNVVLICRVLIQRQERDLSTARFNPHRLLISQPMMLIQTQVKPSAIHGMGLFTVEAVPKNTPIWRFLEGFDHAFSPTQFQTLPPLARDHTRWFCFVSKHDGHVILSGDHACFINHSETPNTGAPPNAPAPVTTVALRDLQAGEEITCNYFAYDADTPWKLGLVDKHAPLGATS